MLSISRKNAIDNAIMYMLSGYAVKKCYRVRYIKVCRFRLLEFLTPEIYSRTYVVKRRVNFD